MLFTQVVKQFKQHGIAEMAQVKAGYLLNFIQPVYQRIAMYVQITRGICQVEVSADENIHRVKHFFVEQFLGGGVE